jgi:dTMP kinase
MTGFFVVVEGPNGVGKSTVVGQAVPLLNQRVNMNVHATKEPSSSRLGEAIRELEPTLPPLALALACAADRLDHVSREIEPALADGRLVISDRYVPSSLVLQRLDGLDLEFVWMLNKDARRADLVVYLDDDAETISKRIAARQQHSRYEARGSAHREVELYCEARDFLGRKGWQQEIIDCRNRSADKISQELVEIVFAAARAHVG